MDGNRSDTRARQGDRDPLLKFQLLKNDYCHFCQSFIGLRMLEVLDQKKFFVIRSLSSTNVGPAARLVPDDRDECIDGEEIMVKRLF